MASENSAQQIRDLNKQVTKLATQGKHAEALVLARRACELACRVLGEDHPSTATSLNNLGGLLREMGDLATALPCLEQALAIRRKTLGPEHPNTATSLTNLGVVLEEMRSYASARSCYEQALAINCKAVGGKHPRTTDSLNNLGRLLSLMGELAGAQPCLEQALENRRETLGQEHPDTATTLNELGSLLVDIGDLRGARPYYEQALDVRRCVLGNDHPTTAISLNNLGKLLYHMGDLTGARSYCEQALAINRRVLGDDDPETAIGLNNLGVLLKSQGDYAGALPYCEQALTIWCRVLGEDHPTTARSFSNLGVLLTEMGDLVAARRNHERALEIRLRLLGDHHLETAQSLNNLGGLFHNMGDLAAARPYYERALEIFRRMLGDDHPSTATSLNNLGGLLTDLGDLAGARPYYEQALEIFRRMLGDDHPDTASSLNNLGCLLQEMGNLAPAWPYLEEALEIQRRVLGDDHLDTASSLNNLGLLLETMGDSAAAWPYYEQALAIKRRVLGDDHPRTFASLNNLGCWLARRNLASARPYLELALEIQRRVLGEDHPRTVQSLNNLGCLLQDMEDLAGARPYLEQALEIQRRVRGNDHPRTATSLGNLGRLLRNMGDLAAARPCFEQALALARRVLGEDHPNTAIDLNNLGMLEVACGRIVEGWAHLSQATAIDDRMIGQVFSIGSDRQRLLFLRQFQNDQDRFLSLVYRHLSSSPEALCTALDLVLRRKAIGAEALAAQRDAVLGGRYPHLREAFDQLTQLRRRLAQKTLAGPAPGETLATHEQTLHQWRQEQQQRETALAREIPEINLEQQLHKADRRAVALSLPEGVALVEFVRFHVLDFHAVPARGEAEWQPARYLAFVLPAGQPDQVQMVDLGEADPIDRMIADFRDSVAENPQDRPDRDIHRRQAESASAAQEQVGPALRAAVFDTLVPALGGCNRLLLAPDGDLTRLPFEVLPNADGRLLVEQYQLSYLSCGRDVLRFGTASTGQAADPLVVADPLFDLVTDGEEAPPSAQTTASHVSRDIRHSGFHFRRLPGTREEGERVAALLGVRPWLEADALEGRLKQTRSPRVLHLATHGFFLEDQPHDPNKELHDPGLVGDAVGRFGRLSGALPENPLLRSGLAQAGAQTWLDGAALPSEAEDGLLTAEDVTGLDLLDTELVVLSACDTGLGEVRTGEGVFGLRRAFTVAGARTLVMSLWKVPDEQTRELMIDFYRRVLAGQGVADSLREAQLAMKTKYPDPYYWGAFICQGDPGPLSSQRQRVAIAPAR